MHADLADHIALIAAPIYAAFLTPFIPHSAEVSAEQLALMRKTALEQALALRLDALEMPAR